jgi:undecaprenyl-diphosphatase
VAAGAAGVAVAAVAVHEDRIGPLELRAFRLVNALPDGLFPAVWPVMQLGALGAVPTVAGVSLLLGDRRLAGRLLAAASASWLIAKVVKRAVRRPRPAVLVTTARHRGREASGLGFVSGHAAVVTALAGVLTARHRALRPVASLAVPIVGLSRIYVGAHLPLDVVGGAALGVAIGAAAGLPDGRGRP